MTRTEPSSGVHLFSPPSVLAAAFHLLSARPAAFSAERRWYAQAFAADPDTAALMRFVSAVAPVPGAAAGQVESARYAFAAAAADTVVRSHAAACVVAVPAAFASTAVAELVAVPDAGVATFAGAAVAFVRSTGLRSAALAADAYRPASAPEAGVVGVLVIALDHHRHLDLTTGQAGGHIAVAVGCFPKAGEAVVSVGQEELAFGADHGGFQQALVVGDLRLAGEAGAVVELGAGRDAVLGGGVLAAVFAQIIKGFLPSLYFISVKKDTNVNYIQIFHIFYNMFLVIFFQY